MKKILLSCLISLLSLSSWACSCFYEDFSFTGIWTTYIEEDWTLPDLVEVVAVEDQCEAMVFQINKVLANETGDLSVGDLVKVWRGDGGLCIWEPYYDVGDVLMLPLEYFWEDGSYYYIENCSSPSLTEYPNYHLNVCGPGVLPVENGMVGDMTYNDFEAFIAESLIWEISNVNLRVFLEGAYNATDDVLNTNLGSVLPLTQPYNVAPYNYPGDESVQDWLIIGFVDWVLVEAREGDPQVTGDRATTTVETKVGLLSSSGTIFSTNGSSPLKFYNLDKEKSYYFCVRHRNHLDILTATALPVNADVVYDFTADVDNAFGSLQQNWNESETRAMMFTGDYNQDGVIQVSDFDIWIQTPAVLDTYSSSDGTLDGVVQTTDFDAWIPNKAKLGTPEIGF